MDQYISETIGNIVSFGILFAFAVSFISVQFEYGKRGKKSPKSVLFFFPTLLTFFMAILSIVFPLATIIFEQKVDILSIILFVIIGGLVLYATLNPTLEFFDVFSTGDPISKDISTDFEDSQKASLQSVVRFKVPKEIIPAFHQYMVFFQEYVQSAKGKTIDLQLKRVANGLDVGLSFLHTCEPEHFVSVVMSEYTAFLSQNVDALSVNTEVKLTETQADILILKLKGQVRHFQNSLDILMLENDHLKKNEAYYRNLISDLVKNNAVININNSFENLRENGDIVIAKFANSKIKHLAVSVQNELTEEVQNEIQKHISSLADIHLVELRQVLRSIQSPANKETEENKVQEVKDFLYEYGIALNQNLSAAAIFEGLKIAVGL